MEQIVEGPIVEGHIVESHVVESHIVESHIVESRIVESRIVGEHGPQGHCIDSSLSSPRHPMGVSIAPERYRGHAPGSAVLQLPKIRD